MLGARGVAVAQPPDGAFAGSAFGAVPPGNHAQPASDAVRTNTAMIIRDRISSPPGTNCNSA
jgi:hypothetical protein